MNFYIVDVFAEEKYQGNQLVTYHQIVGREDSTLKKNEFFRPIY